MHRKVRASKSLLVFVMNDDTAVSEKAGGTRDAGYVGVGVVCFKGSGGGYVAVFSGEVADLAGLGVCGVAWGRFAAGVGVEVGEG